jgi:hypothetical protein
MILGGVTAQRKSPVSLLRRLPEFFIFPSFRKLAFFGYENKKPRRYRDRAFSL